MAPLVEVVEGREGEVIVCGVGRVQLFELHELSWFPALWRDLLTDFLSFYATTFKPYENVAPLLAEALRESGTSKIADLCSGAGRPLLSLLPALQRHGSSDLEVVLTDKYPNLEALENLGETGSDVKYLGSSIDATDVPVSLKGFRTLFTSFHHFRPNAARAVVTSAVKGGEGIGIFEYTERNGLIWGLPTLLVPLFVWICTPFMRPFRWRRLLWTYLVPIVPIVAQWDGFVSCLRSYSVGELEVLVGEINEPGYQWKIGKTRSIGISRITYAIGVKVRG